MRKLLTITALAAFVSLTASLKVSAADKTWDGGDQFDGNHYWGTNANWIGDVAPSSGDSLFFGNSSKVTLTNDFANNTTFSGITFNSGIFSHNLRGNTINLSGGITNLDDSLQTITLNLDLTANTTIEANSVSSSGNIAINGAIGESGGSYGITKTGARTLNLGGNNTFTGGLTISDGVVNLTSSGALNSSSPNAVNIGSSGSLRINGNSVTVSGLTGAGTVQNNHASTAATLTVNKASGTDTFSGNIQNGNTATLAINKTGEGTLVLSGVNSHTGGTTLTEGTLELGSATAIGSGSSANLNFAGGILNANNQTISVGTLTLSADSILNLLDDGNASSLTFSAGNRTGGSLTVFGWSGTQGVASDDDAIFFTSAPNQTFLNNVFFDVDGQLYFSMLNGSNELVPGLTPVPEPTEWALIIFAALAMLYKFGLPRLRKSAGV